MSLFHPFVPNLNFLQVHIVRFNAEKQIQQIKLYWDQGSLLKNVGVIGSRGRSWPIRDPNDQTRFIKSAVSSVGESRASEAVPAASSSKKDDNDAQSGDVASPFKRVLKDPYAADSLYELLSPSGADKAEQPRQTRIEPHTHDYSELFVGGDDDNSPDSAQGRKPAPRAGAVKKFQPSRLFGEEEPGTSTDRVVSPYKSNPKKYSHFEFGEGEDADSAGGPKPTPRAGAVKKFQPSRLFDEEEPTPKVSMRPSKGGPKKYDHFETGG